MYRLIGQEVNVLVRNFKILVCDSLSNTVAMGWRDAAESTLDLAIESPTITSSVYFIYASFLSVFGIYAVVRLNRYFENRQNDVIEYLEDRDGENTEESDRSTLLSFAFVKRSVHLMDCAVKFSIAWSWRMSINAFIDALYSGFEFVYF